MIKKQQTFREFYEMRSNMPFPGRGDERVEVVLKRLADMSADWMDELARRQQEQKDPD